MWTVNNVVELEEKPRLILINPDKARAHQVISNLKIMLPNLQNNEWFPYILSNLNELVYFFIGFSFNSYGEIIFIDRKDQPLLAAEGFRILWRMPSIT